MEKHILFLLATLLVVGCSGGQNNLQDITDYEGVSEICQQGTVEQIHRMLEYFQQRFDVAVLEVGDTCEIPNANNGITEVFHKENVIFTLCPVGESDQSFVVREINPIDWFSGILLRQWIVNLKFSKQSV